MCRTECVTNIQGHYELSNFWDRPSLLCRRYIKQTWYSNSWEISLIRISIKLLHTWKAKSVQICQKFYYPLFHDFEKSKAVCLFHVCLLGPLMNQILQVVSQSVSQSVSYSFFPFASSAFPRGSWRKKLLYLFSRGLQKQERKKCQFSPWIASLQTFWSFFYIFSIWHLLFSLQWTGLRELIVLVVVSFL